ncbi:uncharacterized protein LOC141701224 [Apium graveolens]|uniref:uncharacterized protein LOC141701224 n=1 Tax=Apium graveolens TaxID=4045 RepID=UPI003D7AD2A9
MEESSFMRKILRAVPDKFLQIASNMEQFGDVKGMTIEEVVGHLKAYKKRMKGRSESVDGQLLLTSQNQRPRGGSFRDKTWSQKMKVIMQAYGLWDPKGTVEVKTNKRALAIIYQRISEEMLLTLTENKTSKETWEAVRTMSLGADKVRQAKAQMLKGEFESLSMKDGEQLDDFYMKLHGLVTNIRALREKINSEEVIGSLKAHEERLCGTSEMNQGQLLLTEEEWRKRENHEGQLLLTREEWMKKTREGNRGPSDNRGKISNRGGRDMSRMRCFNCQAFGHFAYECRKSRRDKEPQKEVNLTQIQGDEPALLIVEIKEPVKEMMLINDEMVVPKLTEKNEGRKDL